MSVAILSKALSQERDYVGACIATNDPKRPRIISIGFKKDQMCAELRALSNAQHSRVDLTKCSLYTTNLPCCMCTEAILQAGIRVVVYGEGDLDKQRNMMVYLAKGCFKKYECLIRIDDKEKRFLIDLRHCIVHTKKLSNPAPEQTGGTSGPQQTPIEPSPKSTSQCYKREKPSYKDFFMAMVFLACSRAKDMKCQVGACLVTPSPHRLVALGYNGMPDGRGFLDEKMDWGSNQPKYICHAELNAIIAAFRREADLSLCTLYVTHSPCSDCSKLIAQSGIKNVVFAIPYKEGKDLYYHLGQLPDMNIILYNYHGCNPKLSINLEELNVIQKKPGDFIIERKPRRELTLKRRHSLSDLRQLTLSPWDITPIKGRRYIDFPLDDYFMALAVLATVRCPYGRKVGACLVYQEPRRAISVGYNGRPDVHRGKTTEKDECCAESNAILSAFRYHADLTNSILYTTAPPCPKCAQMIVQSGIRTVVHGSKSKMDKEAKEIFYWAKVATLEYKCLTNKPIIEIDLYELTVEQKEKGTR